MKKISTATDTKDISLTIYNGGFGAVKETRTVSLTGTETELVFSDVAQQIETDSLLVEGLNILEFNYDYDLVDRDKLLVKYIDKDIILKDRKTGEKRSCRLLSVEVATGNYGFKSDATCVFEDNETKEIYIDVRAELIFPSLPSGLIVKPALVWKIAPSKTESVRVSYLTKGFNWNANYVIELLEDSLNISGWAEATNTSGSTFENARIKLIAGDVKRVHRKEYSDDEKLEYSFPEIDCSKVPQAEEKSFFDYHMYTLHNPTTLKNNQTKQINILDGLNIPYRRYYQAHSYDKKANVVVEFANKKESGLGITMPKGKVKLYKTDEADSSLEFIGEDSIEHTPKDEDITLTAGKAFDITITSREVERKIIDGFEHNVMESIIKNHKEEPAEVHFKHYTLGVLEMVSTSHQYKMKPPPYIYASAVEFILHIPADSEIKVDFEFKIDKRVDVVVKKEKLEADTVNEMKRNTRYDISFSD